MHNKEQEEELEFDVLLIGAGPANLACSIHLMDLVKEHNANLSRQQDPKEKPIDIEDKIAIIDKGAYKGANSISGAIMDPSAIKELIVDFENSGFPIESEVTKSSFYVLSKKMAYTVPLSKLLFPLTRNKNNYIVSLGKVNSWLYDEANKRGVVLLEGFSGQKVFYDDNDKVISIKASTIGWESSKDTSYNLRARAFVFGDGSNGSLSTNIIQKFKLAKEPMNYELGCKEVWEIPKGRVKKGQVINTIGYPLDFVKNPGGSFIYALDEDKIAIGLFTYLSSADPLLNTHSELQRLKEHPFVKDILHGGRPLSYGAKVISAGGYYKMPKPTINNAILIGEAAGLLNTKKLKGIHLAIKSGIIAAKVLFKAIRSNDFSANTLGEYESLLQSSSIVKEMYKARNYSNIITSLQRARKLFKSLSNKESTAGNKGKNKADFKQTETIKDFYKNKSINNKDINEEPSKLSIDKLKAVYLSNTRHDETKTSNITIKDKSICKNMCYPMYKAPCTSYCPANVYEIDKEQEIHVHFSNCIHCRAAELKCPFNNIIWEAPQGGDGPKYREM